MGECLIMRRGGEFHELPVLNTSYPKDVTLVAAADGSATFITQIATAGKPAEYAYQWYVNGSKVSGATSSTYTKSGLTSASTYTVYCTVTNKAGTVQSRVATLTVKSYVPVKGDTFTCSGSLKVVDEKDYKWKIYFYGTTTFTPNIDMDVDIFCVGGGAGGGRQNVDGAGGGGGGGGYTTTVKAKTLKAGTAYALDIGAGGNSSGGGGGTTSVKNGSEILCTANGGENRSGSGDAYGGGDGGSGGGGAGRGYDSDGNGTFVKAGAGGTNGGNGGKGNFTVGVGQRTTTREFGESSGTQYAGGGGGTIMYGSYSNSPTLEPTYAAGGDGGGAAGFKSANDNTGGGGGGRGGSGGSGIIVIRSAR